MLSVARFIFPTVTRITGGHNSKPGSQIMPMPDFKKTRVFFPNGVAVYFPDHPDMFYDESDPSFIDMLYPRDFVLANVPAEYIVADEDEDADAD